MLRFKVVRLYIKYKGKMYRKGELLPPEFTERDKYRNLYPSRIAVATQGDLDLAVAQAFTGAPASSEAPIVESGEGNQDVPPEEIKQEASVALTGNSSANTSTTTGTIAPKVAPNAKATVTVKK